MRTRMLPILADLSSANAGELPLDLLMLWEQSDRSLDFHGELLAPYKVHGYFLTSDSAGLSKLSQQMSLPEVQREISKPKDIVYAFCVEAGGIPVGIWMADNTECFFPSSIPADTILKLATRIQQANAKNLVQIGISISYGTAYQLPGGLYGHDADHNEHIAESSTEGGEIVIAQTVLDKRDGQHGWDTTPTQIPGYHRLTYNTDETPAIPNTSGHYPIPYSEPFYQLLQSEDATDAAFASLMTEQYVLLVAVQHAKQPLLMEHFSSCALTHHELLSHTQTTLIKSNGMLAIYTSPNAHSIIEEAKQLQSRLAAIGYRASMGIAYGELFIFDLPNGQHEIAGNPVNIASKLAEDSGAGGILIEDHVANAVSGLQGEPFGITLSGVTLSGIRLS